MNRVAWLTCALLALAHGRIYERCELARDLQAFGVDPDDISTWVCIAYHESRFDTNANNPYSGDHGIFQISELYWCGPGKACGLSCSALRDDDISNDLECALQVHEEHTRLQGNGFLAWVVYPQHCKHNTKKYLVDCDTSLKSHVPITKSRPFAYKDRYFPNLNYTSHNVEELLPPYLAIGNILKGGYSKVLDQSKGGIDWYNYKINNIDDLKLPSTFVKPQRPVTEPTTTTTTTTTQTTTTTYIPPVMPWRTIETNQFRKKPASKPTTEKEHLSVTSNQIQNTKSTTYQTPSIETTTQRPHTIPTPKYVSKITSSETPTTPKQTSTTFVTWPPTQRTTIARPTTRTASPTKVETTTQKPRLTSTFTPLSYISTQKSLFTSTAKRTTVLSTTEWPTASTGRTKSWSAITKPTTTTVRAITSTTAPRTSTFRWTTVSPISPSWTIARPITAAWTTARPTTTSWTKAKPTAASLTAANQTRASWTTQRPTITTWTTRPTTKWATVRPPTTLSTTAKIPPTVATTKPKWYEATSKATITKQPKTDFSWYTFTSRTATAAPTTKKQSAYETTTTRPISYSTTTLKHQTTTHKPKTTQSIFDLYLNPTKPPKLPAFRFDSSPESKFRLKIFASGTTTPAPAKQTTTLKRNDSGNAAKNQIKRQNLHDPHYSQL